MATVSTMEPHPVNGSLGEWRPLVAAGHEGTVGTRARIEPQCLSHRLRRHGRVAEGKDCAPGSWVLGGAWGAISVHGGRPQSSPGTVAGLSTAPGTPRDDGEMAAAGTFLHPFPGESVSDCVESQPPPALVVLLPPAVSTPGGCPAEDRAEPAQAPLSAVLPRDDHECMMRAGQQPWPAGPGHSSGTWTSGPRSGDSWEPGTKDFLIL